MTFGNTKTGKTGTSTSEATETAHIKSIESLDKDNDMERGLKNRHVQFIAIGGTIGTGLFLGSGKSIALTGPSIIFVYIGVGLIMFLLMRAIGEMMYSDPSQHTFINFITRYLGRGWGKFAGWTYWIVLILTGMTEITAVSTYFVTFFGTFGIDLNAWKWLIELCFLVALTGINLIAVKVFGEAEFWFASIKVFAIIAFIVIGLLAIFGAIPIAGHDSAPLLGNFVAGGWFPSGIAPIFSTLLTVVFAFSGTEVVGVAAGETKDPSRAIPKAVHTTVLRLAIFFIGSILVMAALIPWHQAGVDTSPFVLVFQSIGMPFAGDIMNFVVLTAVLSAANSGLYVCSRMVWSLAKERLIPERFARTNFRGVPVWAVLFSMAGSLLALLSSVIAASTVYLVLVAVSGLATLVVWFSVCVCHIRFRREWARDGHSADELGYRAPGFPVLPWLAIVMCIGALVLVVLDDTQRSTLYCMIPFVACCYAAYYALERQRKRENNA